MFKKTPAQKGQEVVDILLALPNTRYNKRVTMIRKIDRIMASGDVLIQPQGEGSGKGILAYAVDHNIALLINHCLVHEIDLDVAGHQGETPLAKAIRLGNATVFNALIERPDVDRRRKSANGTTMLINALTFGYLDFAQRLARDNSLHDKTNNGFTCLNAAILSKKVECVDWVIAAGLPLNATYDGQSYVYHAAKNGCFDIFQRLRAAGASFDPDEKGSDGLSITNYLYHRQIYGQSFRDLYTVFCAESKKRAEKREVQEQATAKKKRTGWRLINKDTVCLIEEQDAIGYRVTEIFNFNAGLYTRINHNLNTKAESTAVMPLSQIDRRGFVEQAAKKLAALGGNDNTLSAESSVLKRIEKGGIK